MNTYKVYYNSKETIIEADSLWGAKQKAIAIFRVPKSKTNLIAIVNSSQKITSNYNLY